jgi:RNA polymerase sigma factor (sigma-70 family)
VTPLISTTLLRTQSDERLVRLTAAGYDRAFEAIVERYRRPLLRHARRLLGDGPRAEDVVQAALVSAWAALRDGVDVRDLRPWLYRIVHNGALNALKRPGDDHAELPATLAAAAGPESDFERRDTMRRTLDAVAALPDRQRAALVAIAVNGRPHGEVAAELGLTSGAVRQLVRRARTSLRAVATAVTPGPAAAWAAGAIHEATAARIAEVAAGAGGAGLTGAALKAGALAVTAGAIVAGAPQDVARLVSPRHQSHRTATAAAAPKAATPRAPAVATAPRPLEVRAVSRHGGGATSGHRHVAAAVGPLRREDAGARREDAAPSESSDRSEARRGSSGSDDRRRRISPTSTSGDGSTGDSSDDGGTTTTSSAPSGSDDGGSTTTMTPTIPSATDGGTSTTPQPPSTDGGTGTSGSGDALAAPSGTGD